jgi:ElaB/YqjD/DUF883 family membrane-anchored ribosome-binding protein
VNNPIANNPEQPAALVDKAADSAEQALNSMQRVGQQAQLLAQRGLDEVRQQSHRLEDHAHRLSDSAANYVRQDPLKAVLIAAAAGAGLMALLGLLRRPGA